MPRLMTSEQTPEQQRLPVVQPLPPSTSLTQAQGGTLPPNPSAPPSSPMPPEPGAPQYIKQGNFQQVAYVVVRDPNNPLQKTVYTQPQQIREVLSRQQPYEQNMIYLVNPQPISMPSGLELAEQQELTNTFAQTHPTIGGTSAPTSILIDTGQTKKVVPFGLSVPVVVNTQQQKIIANLSVQDRQTLAEFQQQRVTQPMINLGLTLGAAVAAPILGPTGVIYAVVIGEGANIGIQSAVKSYQQGKVAIAVPTSQEALTVAEESIIFAGVFKGSLGVIGNYGGGFGRVVAGSPSAVARASSLTLLGARASRVAVSTGIGATGGYILSGGKVEGAEQGAAFGFAFGLAGEVLPVINERLGVTSKVQSVIASKSLGGLQEVEESYVASYNEGKMWQPTIKQSIIMKLSGLSPIKPALNIVGLPTVETGNALPEYGLKVTSVETQGNLFETEIRPSTLHGEGVFAKEAIPEGVSLENINLPKGSKGMNYTHDLQQANVEIINTEAGHYSFTTKPIAPGEELTYLSREGLSYEDLAKLPSNLQNAMSRADILRMTVSADMTLGEQSFYEPFKQVKLEALNSYAQKEVIQGELVPKGAFAKNLLAASVAEPSSVLYGKSIEPIDTSALKTAIAKVLPEYSFNVETGELVLKEDLLSFKGGKGAVTRPNEVFQNVGSFEKYSLGTDMDLNAIKANINKFTEIPQGGENKAIANAAKFNVSEKDMGYYMLGNEKEYTINAETGKIVLKQDILPSDLAKEIYGSNIKNNPIAQELVSGKVAEPTGIEKVLGDIQTGRTAELARPYQYSQNVVVANPFLSFRGKSYYAQRSREEEEIEYIYTNYPNSGLAQPTSPAKLRTDTRQSLIGVAVLGVSGRGQGSDVLPSSIFNIGETLIPSVKSTPEQTFNTVVAQRGRQGQRNIQDVFQDVFPIGYQKTIFDQTSKYDITQRQDQTQTPFPIQDTVPILDVSQIQDQFQQQKQWEGQTQTTPTENILGLTFELPSFKFEGDGFSVHNTRKRSLSSRRKRYPILTAQEFLDVPLAKKLAKKFNTAFRATKGKAGIAEYKIAGKEIKFYPTHKRRKML
jgi:hypothetical protein